MSLIVKDNKISIHRGDKGVIPFKIPINEEKTEFYIFQIGDIVTFGVYEEDGYDKCAVILKDFEITKETDTCKIELTSEDTKIGEVVNDDVEYWYEVILNHDETVLGFDEENGAKIFLLLPEGSGKKC